MARVQHTVDLPSVGSNSMGARCFPCNKLPHKSQWAKGAETLKRIKDNCLCSLFLANIVCLVDLGRDTRTSTQSRRIVRRKDASWSLNWPSGENLLARKQHMYFFWCLCDYCVLVFLCYWESIN